MVTIERLSIWTIAVYFIVYLVVHIIIGIKQKQYQEECKLDPQNEGKIKILKALTFLLKWWPAIYLVFILFTL